jgi:hypothetical protein
MAWCGLGPVPALEAADCQFVIPANVTVDNDSGACGARVNYTLPATSGECTGVTVACDPAPGSLFRIGETTVSCAATIAQVQVAQCSFTVKVEDVESPQISYPSGITKCADEGANTAIVDFAVEVKDNCSDVTVTCTPRSGHAFPIGQTTVNCSSSAGGSGGVTFVVEVTDCGAPKINCPADIIKNCADEGQCTAVVPFTVTANGGATVVCEPASGSAFKIGDTEVKCTATAGDKSSRCSFKVTVTDCLNPQLACPANLTKCLPTGAETVTVTYDSPAATDTCSSVTVACDPASGSAFAKGIATVTCTATDAAGNEAECSFTVTVNDCEPLAISCPSADITVPTEADQCSAAVSYQVTANKTAAITCDPAPGSRFAKGESTVTCTASTTGGETATCSFKVKVNDTQLPQITCPGDITRCVDAGVTSVAVTFNVTATDACEGVTVVCDPASGSSFNRELLTSIVRQRTLLEPRRNALLKLLWKSA